MKRSIIKKLACLLLAAMMLSLAACSNADPTKPTDPNAGINSAPAGERVMQLSVRASANGKKRQADEAFCAAQTGFAVELFKSALKKGENSLVSPLSVMLALAMTANGADGETLGEMEKVLGMPIDALNEYLAWYMGSLVSNEDGRLSIANSIWYRAFDFEFDPAADGEPLFEPYPAFLEKNAEAYNADIFKAPFDESTLNAINKWVSENTDGMIDHIIDRLDPMSVMYLVNTLLFEADWYQQYESWNVTDGVFTSVNGDRREVEMLNGTEGDYYEGENCIGFAKAYKNTRYAFAALLPNEGVDIGDFISGLTGEELMRILNNPDQTGKVITAMPKFSFDFSTDLPDALKAMGMGSAFSPDTADFTRMGKTASGMPIYIGNVIHKTHIEVSEAGTRAAASTVVEILCGSAYNPDVKEVVLDRPFVFMIIDTETNVPLFIGALTDI